MRDCVLHNAVPLNAAASHPTLPSPQQSVSGPGRVGIPIRAKGGMEPAAGTGSTPVSSGDSLT